MKKINRYIYRERLSKDNFKKKYDFLNQPIEKYMTKHLIYIKPKEKIIKALEIMKMNGIRHLPVYTKIDKNLYGVISYKDFTIKSIGSL